MAWQRIDTMARDVGDAAGLLAPLEVGVRILDGDVPCSLWQLRLFEAYAAAFGYRSGREQLDDVDRFDPPRPCFEVAEHFPNALLRGVDIDRFLKAHVRRFLRKVAHPRPVGSRARAAERDDLGRTEQVVPAAHSTPAYRFLLLLPLLAG